MLYGVEVPAVGNETRFCDMVAAYAALDDEMKARLEDVVVIHGQGNKKLMLKGGYRGRADVPSLPQVYHRLVQSHPVTGEKLLYAPAGSPAGVVGMEEEEALDLLLKDPRDPGAVHGRRRGANPGAHSKGRAGAASSRATTGCAGTADPGAADLTPSEDS